MVLKGGRKSFVVSLPTYRFEKSASLLFLKWRVTSWGQPKKDDSNLKLSLFSFFLEENSLVMKLSCQSNSALSAVHFTTTTCWRIIGIPQQTDREVKLLPFSTRLQHRDFNEETLNSSWRIPIRKTSSLLLPTTPKTFYSTLIFKDLNFALKCNKIQKDAIWRSTRTNKKIFSFEIMSGNLFSFGKC